NGSIAELTQEIASGKIPDLEIESLTNSKIVAAYKNELPDEVAYKKLSDEVDIASFFIEDLYLSRVGHYAMNPVGHFTLKCSVPVFDVRVNLTIPELLDDTFRVMREHIDAGESKFDINIVPLIKKAGNILQTRILHGQLELCYTINEKAHTRSLGIPVTVYGINGMNWNTPSAISCFVTSEDTCVRSFSRMAMQNLTCNSEYGSNFVNTMAVWAAIKKHNIQYTKDPAPVLGTAIDMVQYPSQTLSYKTGDCDDISVLYCSVLLSLGIDVALLSYDDHVFFMFNTGIYEKNRMMLSPDTTMTIINNKKVWIPIESTDMQSSFVDNWRNTSQKFYKMVNAGMNVEIIDIREAWKTYPPNLPIVKEQSFTLKPVNDEVKAELQKVYDTKTVLYTKEIDRLKSVKKSSVPNMAAVKNKLGLLHIHIQNYQKAATFFKQAYQISKSPQALSNHAGALLLCGKEKEAQKIFDEIYKEDTDGKIAVNRTLCRYVSLNEGVNGEAFYDCILEALSIVNSDVKLAEILGFDITGSDSSRATNGAQFSSKSIDIDILRQHIRTVSDSLRNYTISGITTESSSGKLSGITTESSSGTKISGITTESSSGMNIAGTTTETSTGSTTTANNYAPKKFGGLRGMQVGDLQKLVYLLYWFEF
ncbi:MAG: hypothetical protein Q4F84_03665, partial [Fibrobacter sp.]|nr:hypothetical protein [Fibrobacter sp.]